MVTEIKYTNLNNKILTNQQLVQTEEYSKHTYIDGALKISETNRVLYKKNIKSKHISYFLDIGENADTIAPATARILSPATARILSRGYITT